jgi:hypothetical protein
MTAIPADIQKAAEIAVFAFEARIQGGEFEGLDPNGTEARDALKAEIAKAINAERERAASRAENWLLGWAADLQDTRDSYIEARRTGRHNGRRITVFMAATFAGNFRERSDAVHDCAAHVVAAIRSPQPSPTAGA